MRPRLHIPLISAFALGCAGPVLGLSCGSGPPAGLAADAAGTALQIVVPAKSSTAGATFFVLDAYGYPLGDVEVEFTTVEGSTIEFAEIAPSLDGNSYLVPASSPRRIRLRTPRDCKPAAVPPLSTQGSSDDRIAARILSAPGVSSVSLPAAISIPVKIVNALSTGLERAMQHDFYLAHERGPADPPPMARTTWRAGAMWGGLGGQEVTLSVNTAGGRFSNGQGRINVTTDAFGVAGSSLSFDSPGFIEAQVDAAPPFRFSQPLVRYGNAGRMVIGPVSGPASIRYGESAQVEAPYSPSWRFEWPWRGLQFEAFHLRGPGIDLPLARYAYATSPIMAELDELPIGTHDLTIEQVMVDPPVRSAPFSIEVRPHYESPSARGNSTLAVGLGRGHQGPDVDRCELARGAVGVEGDSGFPTAAPAGVELPFGMVAFDLVDCDRANLWFTSRGWTPATVQQVALASSVSPPAGAGIWVYGASQDDSSPHWQEVPATMGTTQSVFRISGNQRPVIAIGVRREGIRSYQDLWWAGPAEDGWGMSLTQHGERVFGALFVYDADGAPRWLVLPGGQWDASGTVFTANVYRPRGSPYANYRAAAFQPGAPVGTARLEFTARDRMTLRYTIDGLEGTKDLERQLFGPLGMPAEPIADLWWGGKAQNGWGVAIHQQGRSVFMVWFTYDGNGETTWFVAPSGILRNSQVFETPLYRTRGSPWLGTAYDPSGFGAYQFGRLSLERQEGDRVLHVWAEEGELRFSSALERQPF